MYKIIKEVAPNNICVVRSLSYGHTMQYIQTLYTEALSDFPDLALDDVRVVHFAGRSYARTFGIEFLAKSNSRVPDSYLPIKQLETTC